MTGAGRTFAIRSAVFCATVFVGIGISLPFFPLWLAEQGFSGSEIAMIVAAPLFARTIFTPLLAAAADRFSHLALASALYALAAGLLISSLAIFSGFWSVLVISAAAFMVWNTLIPLADTVIIAGVRDHGIDYARVRLWGSVGFIAGSIGAAVAMREFRSDGLFLLLVVAFFAGSLIALALPRVSAAGNPLERVGVRQAFSDPVLRRALFAGNLVLASHAAYYVFGSLYWERHAFSAGAIGVLWSLGVVAEIGLFFAAKLLPEWDARRFLLAGAAGALLRWALFPFATTLVAALPLQILHALSFACVHIGIMMAIGAVATPGHTAQLQAAHQLIGGVLIATMMLAVGPLFRTSPVLNFWLMAALAVPAIVLAAGLRRGLQPQSAASGGSTRPPV